MVRLFEPSALIVPPTQWQLQLTWIFSAVRVVRSLPMPLATTPTRSPFWTLGSEIGILSLPDVSSVFESTETVTDWPFRAESCGPVQSTEMVRELVPTALTEPANQCAWALAIGVAVVVV